MPRIRIKHPRPREGQTKLQLLQIVAEENIFLAGVHVANDALIAITATEKDADKLLAKKTVDLLTAQDFTPIIPFEVRCRRSIICHHVDDVVFENSEEDIKEEVVKQQSWAKVIRVTKFPNRQRQNNTFKIELEESNIAEKAEGSRLLMFQMSITPNQIRREQYTPLLTCLKCYKIEDHITKDCNMPPDYKICSECCSPGHTYRECQSQVKKCINCGDNHRTMAMRCRTRKEAIKRKEVEKKSAESRKSNQTYSSAAAKPGANEANTALLSSLPSDSPLTKYFIGMLHAHFLNSIEPGSYQRHYSEFAKLNKLQDVIWPPNIPSQKILENIMPTTAMFAAAAATSSTNVPSHVNENSNAANNDNNEVNTSTQSSVDSMAEVDIENMSSPSHPENHQQESQPPENHQQESQPPNRQQSPHNTQHTSLSSVTPRDTRTRRHSKQLPHSIPLLNHQTTQGPRNQDVRPKTKNNPT